MISTSLTFVSKKGDPGGPLICGSKENEKVYGVTSWGLGCAKGVNIYARVAFHRDWIDKEIKVNRLRIILSKCVLECICGMVSSKLC